MQRSEKQIMGQPGPNGIPLILGIDGLTAEHLQAELASGGRLVFFEYCISFIFFTLRHPSPIYFLRSEQWRWPHGLPYTFISLLLGWWGLPWGIVYTPLTMLTNMAGGRDITAEVRSQLPNHGS
jgi:hypothetical protein